MKKNMHFYALICFLAAPLLTSNCNALNEEQENKVLSIMKDFLDVNNKKDRSFESYANELLQILKTDPKFTPFYIKLNTLLQNGNRNANLYGLAFIKNKNLMPKTVLEFLKKYNTQQLKSIFQQRLNIKSIPAAPIPAANNTTAA